MRILFNVIFLLLLSACTQIEEPEFFDIFIAGEETITGYEGQPYAQFREQNVVVTSSGKIVVAVQGRNASMWSDRSGQDLWCKISGDYGASWGEPVFIASHELKSICPNAAVYDSETNRIHILYNLFLWDYTNVPEDVKGELGDINCKQFVVTSDDEGLSWSEPREISEMIDTDGAVMVVGSGEGIQLSKGEHSGRLIIAGGDFNKGKKVLCYYSDDHGETWNRSKTVPWKGDMSWASESKVAELPDGTIILNSRTFVKTVEKQRYRTRAFSKDGGYSWSVLENDTSLITVSCNGSLISVRHPNNKNKTLLLCSVPVGPGRTHGTVYVSFDNGFSWPLSKMLIEDHFAYSSLVELPDGGIGLFYETNFHKDIRMIKFTKKWLLNK